MSDLSEIFEQIIRERGLQDSKWGADRVLNPMLWNTILLEEVGEVANASLERDLKAYRAELIQVGALAVAMIEAVDAGRINIDGGRGL